MTTHDRTARYNERVTRARIGNASGIVSPGHALRGENDRLHFKLLPFSPGSPVPRSAHKEYASARRLPRCEHVLENVGPQTGNLLKDKPFMPTKAANVKNNPFLLADKAAKVARTTGEGDDREVKVARTTKRSCVSEVSEDTAAEGAHMIGMDVVNPCPESAFVVSSAEVLHATSREEETEMGVQVVPTPQKEITSHAPIQEDTEVEEQGGITQEDTEVEVHLGAQAVNAKISAEVCSGATAEVGVAQPSCPPACVVEGDLNFLTRPVEPELVVAVSNLLPSMEQQLHRARQAEATAESLIDVVRRQRRANKRSRK
eukprot:CAMPEP_0183339542 /NCGR_PEP_ID=MMETSP0164_2-20130417/6423_1 /TAXON_ID=221442 /ORGANISM="Coccolithus pelagicus ssp braarudi, Strain PLY182g" /LENGTH=315 /DNA_ID=CAMNT_0025509543 /DNA_START=24 /DNA_END=971 /DNA_ORIENTATION=-